MIPPGVKTVTCTDCGVTGSIVIRSEVKGKVRVLDYITHKESCSQFVRPQPMHLRSRKSVRKQERRANDLVGAHETAASGAVGMDGDGRSFNRWRVESKQTKYSTFSVSQKVWSKLVVGALRVGEEPLLHVELREQIPYKRICVIRKELYQQWSKLEYGAAENKIVSAARALPYELLLEPPAIALEEVVFKTLKETHGF